MKQQHRIMSYATIIGAILLIAGISYFLPELKQFASPTYLRDLILQAGEFGYFLTILLLLSSVPLPIPSSSVVLVGGYVYGLIGGTILSLIGILIGGTISFFLARYFGRKLLEKLVDKHHIIHFNHLFKKRGVIIAFIAFIIPIFPDDAVMMLLGLTPIRYPVFLLTAFIAHIPRLLLINSIGSDLYHGFTKMTYILLAISLLMALVAIFREKIKRFMFKELRELERDVEREVVVVEREVGKVEREMGWKKKRR